MKALKKHPSRLPLSLTLQAVLYPIVFLIALIFARLHRSALSYAVFLFILTLPILSGLYLLAARLCIHAALRVSEKTPEKKKFITVNAAVSSPFPLPFPFVEAVLCVPGESGCMLCEKSFMMSLLPFSGAFVAHSVFFAFRGEYELCLSHIYVYDLFRCVRLRISTSCTAKIFVMPRKLSLPAYADITNGTEASGADGIFEERNSSAQSSDIRPYAVGDSPKHIHWKLSSKSEELLVRDRSGEDIAGVNIICDLEARFCEGGAFAGFPTLTESANIADLMLCDSAVECTLAAVSAELERGNTVYLSWISKGEPKTVKLCSDSDFGNVYRRFAAEMPSSQKEHVKRICAQSEFVSKLPTVVVTPYIGKADANIYRSLFGKAGIISKAEILYCIPDGIFVPHELSKLEEDTSAILNSAGIALTRISV